MFVNPINMSEEFARLDKDAYLRHVNRMAYWWNEHDNGSRPWTNISFGTVCVQKTAAYTATASDHVILVNSTAGAVTITLPTAIGINGRRYTIKDWKGQSAANNITVDGAGAETIDGAATKVLNANYASVTIVSDNAGWAII